MNAVYTHLGIGVAVYVDSARRVVHVLPHLPHVKVLTPSVWLVSSTARCTGAAHFGHGQRGVGATDVAMR